MITVNEENYFEIAEAIHTVLTLWHDGKHGYVLLCRSHFRPGMGWRETDVIAENEYYSEVNALVESEDGKFLGYSRIEKLLDEVNEFVDKLHD